MDELLEIHEQFCALSGSDEPALDFEIDDPDFLKVYGVSKQR
jgi:hypothetical protein